MDTGAHAKNSRIRSTHKETVTHAETSTIAPTHKEILSDPKLFNTYITDLDHDLNYTPTSNTPNPLPQLAHPPLTEVHENSIRTTKSTVPSNGSTEALTSTHSNSTNLDHDLHPNLKHTKSTPITSPYSIIGPSKKLLLHHKVNCPIKQYC